MTHDSQLLRLEHSNSGDLTDMLQASSPGTRGLGAAAPSIQNPVARVRSIMHGRWKYAIPLAIACAAAGAWLGFISKVPRYRGYAQIVYNPVEHTDSGPTGMIGFENYVSEQCTIIKSTREINLALQEPVWRDTQRGNTDEVVSEFNKKLEVDHSAGRVDIQYIDDHPEVALAAVKATLSAYKKLYLEFDPNQVKEVLNLLENEIQGYINSQAALSDQSKRICGDGFTPETLARYYVSKMEERSRTEISLLQTQLDADVLRAKLKNAGLGIPDYLMNNEIAAPSTEPAATLPAIAAASQPATAPAVASPPKNIHLTPEDVAAHDQHMEILLDQLRSAQASLKAMQAPPLNLPSNNPSVKSAAVVISRIQIEIDAYLADVTGRGIPTGTTSVRPSSDPRLAELETLVVTYRELRVISDRARAQSQDLGEKVTQLQKIQEQQEDIKRRLQLDQGKRDTLNNQYKLSNRANFLSDGDLEYGAYEDKRKSYGAFGGIFGALIGFGAIFLMGFLDQRVKTIADAKYTFRRSRRVLGILPTLPDNLGDPRQAAFAAHCVHHVRNLLQLSMAPDRGSVLAVTSASPGEGKTSLTLSLGLSFAAANSRTLMIDCDVVGGGLTARVNAIIRRKMGDVLKRQGRINEQQLNLALQLANHKDMRLGEAIVELGFLSAADIDEALNVQKESLIGLLDVLDGEPLNSCITNAGSPNLFILPRGMAVASNSGQVSAKAIRRIIAEARAQYDVVLIDTGPVLGSLEASIVASESDGVVLAVSRGQQKSLAERAMELLDSIGANTAGIVFNRAQTDDMDTIQYSSSIPANALQSVPQQTAGGSGTSRLGPIAFAVASATNQSTAHRNPSGNGHVNGAAPASKQPVEPSQTDPS